MHHFLKICVVKQTYHNAIINWWTSNIYINHRLYLCWKHSWNKKKLKMDCKMLQYAFKKRVHFLKSISINVILTLDPLWSVDLYPPQFMDSSVSWESSRPAEPLFYWQNNVIQEKQWEKILYCTLFWWYQSQGWHRRGSPGYLR